MIGLDCETYRIGARLTPRVVSIQIEAGGRPTALYTREAFDDAFDILIPHLANGGHVVGQNVAYDLACLCVERDDFLDVVFEAYRNGQIRCTMIREQLIAIALGQFRSWRFNLDAIVDRRFGVKLSGKKGADVWRLRFSELDGKRGADWPRSAYQYAIDDAKWALKVFDAQENFDGITDAGRRVMPLPDEKEQTAAAWALHLLSVWGVKVDRKAADKWVSAIETEAKQHLELARDGGFLRDNGTKDVLKLRELIREGYDGGPPLTEKGTVKTDRDTLLGSGNPALIAYAEGSAVQKLANTYAKELLGVDSVHPRYNALRRSGRTSCEKPNFQQAPRDGRGFRECFIPRTGVFVLCDYDQIELVALGQILLWWCGHSSIADAVKAGRDLHCEVAAKLKNIHYNSFLESYKIGYPWAKKLRQFAKVANYGFPGGLSSASFSQYAQSFGLDIGPNEAAEIRKAWLEAWPEMRTYFDKIGLACRSGSITIVQEVSGRQRGGVSWTAACNGFFQALVADGAKSALVEVTRRCYTQPGSRLFNSRPVAFLHDEIILESPPDLAADAAVELSEVMIECMGRYIPDLPISADPVLAARWSKEAERIVENGKLKVWA